MYLKKVFFSLTLLLILSAFHSRAQLLFYDDFSDGDFSIDSTWTGTPSKFRVNSERVLQLFDTAAGTAVLAASLPPMLLSAEYNFFVKISFSPSASNFARIWLQAAGDSLTGTPDGYYIQLGEAGSNDAPELYRLIGGIRTLLIRGTPGLAATSFELDFKLTRDHTGLWKMYAGAPGGVLLPQGTFKDSVFLPPGTHWGVYARYTATNRDKFYFDKFRINVFTPDTLAPVAVATEKVGTRSVIVQFNESLKAESISTTQFYAEELGFSSEAYPVPGDASQVQLYFAQDFVPGKIYTLTVKGPADTEGNAGVETHRLKFGRARAPYFNDLLITEIFADEQPQVQLPEAEFLELHNRSNQLLSTEGITLSDNTSTTKLPAAELMPGEYLILCATANSNQYTTYGRTLGVSGFPSLNNAGERLTLRDVQNKTIFTVNYSDKWLPEEKRAGGWSLEMIDTQNPCAGSRNWTASTDPSGGTPGRANAATALNPDERSPEIRSINYTNDTLFIQFDEPIDAGTSEGVAVNIFGETTAAKSWLYEPEVTTLLLIPAAPLVNQKQYTLQLNSYFDCAGNTGEETDYKFIVPEKPVPGEIIINEILFNPYSGSYDFVELYNSSGKHLNIKNCLLQNATGSSMIIIAENYILQPYAYVAVSQNINDLAGRYPRAVQTALLETGPLPSFNSDEGTVKLYFEGGELSDELQYSDKMHHPLLRDTKGVSLERISSKAATDDANNWHSAAESVGFATPGYRNSQDLTQPGNLVTVEPPLFSPDGDGYNDYALINYRFDKPGTSGKAEIYNLHGRLIKTLYSDTQLPSEGFIQWDGTDEEYRAVPYGSYILIFNVFDLTGSTHTHKLKVSVGGKIN